MTEHEHVADGDDLLDILDRLPPEDRELLRRIAVRLLRGSDTDRTPDEAPAKNAATTEDRPKKRTISFAGMIDGPPDLSTHDRRTPRQEIGAAPDAPTGDSAQWSWVGGFSGPPDLGENHDKYLYRGQ